MSNFFTIITSTYNAEKDLPRLLASLESQTCQDFTWMCQDNLSSDATLAIVDTWRDKLPQIKVYSEKDSGIYDAWNKALAHAGPELGQWVIFLGADDQLASPDVLDRVKAVCMDLAESVILCAGQLQHIDDSGCTYPIQKINISHNFIHRLHQTALPHSATFARGELFEQNIFDAKLCILGDKDWLLKVWKAKEQAVSLDFMVTLMARGGISDNPAHDAIQKRENRKILWQNRPSKLTQWPLYTFTCFEVIFYPFKMWIKNCLEKNKYTQKIWIYLHNKRSAILQKKL